MISDVNMPHMDGFELLKRIRSQASTKALRVILLTGRGDTEDVVAGIGLGADDYLIKPFALRELMARVRAKIERPSVPASTLTRDRPTGVLSEASFAEELEREVSRARKTKRGGCSPMSACTSSPGCARGAKGRAWPPSTRTHRFRSIRVEGSESKAQNVNAALSESTGEFIGIFDADHHPDPHCFHRAWRWLASGYDVVQGHCMVRNGDETWVSRLVAVEFEAIYAVSHPGRARLHHFGIFGGSNGYWKARLLHETRMHAYMLTEDIDSSIRALLDGRRIASDPFVVSRELAPVTLHALWNQRMRWAQGWFQVSYRYLLLGLASPKVTLRQKLGLVHLLTWRELYPWIANQMIPIIIFWTIKFGGLNRIDWLVPIFVLTTIFTLGTGPAQTVLAWRLAHRDIRRHGGWFIYYLVMSSLFYTAFKNLIAVVAQVNEAMQQRKWMVTPRTARIAATTAELTAGQP